MDNGTGKLPPRVVIREFISLGRAESWGHARIRSLIGRLENMNPVKPGENESIFSKVTRIDFVKNAKLLRVSAD